MRPLLTIQRRSLLTASAVVTLAACAGAVTVTGHKNISDSYLPTELYVVASGDNELRTVIVGDPFDLPKAKFETAVLAAMAGRNLGQPLNLSTNPKHKDARKRHVVLAFNLAEGSDRDTLCEEPIKATFVQATSGPLSVTGAYCAGDLPLTRATARAGQVTGIESGQFGTLMTQLAIALFPPTNRRAKGNVE